MADIKWSAFPNGGTMVSGDQLVGLRSGANTRLTPVINTQVQSSAFNFAASTGINDAFVVTLSPAPAAYTDGMLVTMYSGTLSNLTTSPTLKVNTLAAVSIITFSGSIAPGDIQNFAEYVFVYNANANKFQLINPTVSAADSFLVQENFYSSSGDTGVANAYAVTLIPTPIGSLGNGFPIYMAVANTNTTVATIAVNGAAPVPIVSNTGSALVGGELVTNRIAFLIYNASAGKFYLQNSQLAPITSGVTSVSGTTNRITSTSGLTPVIDISASYVGQSSITTLGTIGTGTWQGAAIGVPYGGTGLTSTTINQLLYSSAANTIAGLATGNSSVLVTSAGGVPSLSTALPSGLTATNMSLTTPTLGVATATSLTFSPTTNGIVGTTTNNNVAAGSVGEFVSSIVTVGASVSLVTLTPANVTSISLTAGDWDVWGLIFVSGSSTSSTAFSGAISSSSATLPSTFADNTSFCSFSPVLNFATYGGSGFAVPAARISLSTTTTIYLCTQLTFSGGTGLASGFIRARRVR